MKMVDRPLERSFSSIVKWLERGFRVNPNTHFVSVDCLVSFEVEGDQWDLMRINNTEEWKFYMETAVQRGWPLSILVRIEQRAEAGDTTYDPPRSGTSAGAGLGFENTEALEVHTDVNIGEYHPSTPVVEAGHEAIGGNVTAPVPEGFADEGERIPGIVEQMNNEDQLVQEMEENGYSSDDEEAPMPAVWRDPGFGEHEVQDGRSREWEYRANEVVQGAKYATIEAVKEAVKLWSLSLMKEFRVVKSSKTDYDVKCVDVDCPWRVHAHKGKFKSHWECTIVVEHTCLFAGVEKAHRNLTSAFIANEMMTEAPFLPRERLFKQQHYFQNMTKHTYLKGRYDVITSVAIPLALAASSMFMIGRGVYNMSHGIGKKE
ncbi:hypothetical protein U9M48_016051 [Paspalum notatum var. saurae]|uniref:Transposase MuDR plant domain-containing protein n=1 Tax=Paspalum notatum var. saurae TaxID=547442 RepID=A0AAQ3WMN9_PASNO